MIEVMNKLRQPLVINLDDESSVHLLSRGKVELTPEQFKSKEVKMHLAKENLIVLKMD